MESQSARLEREAEEARWQLTGTLEELCERMTPGRVIDQVIDYAQDSAAAEFLRNLGREVRDNPIPLVLIGIGIAWFDGREQPDFTRGNRCRGRYSGRQNSGSRHGDDCCRKQEQRVGTANCSAFGRPAER